MVIKSPQNKRLTSNNLKTVAGNLIGMMLLLLLAAWGLEYVWERWFAPVDWYCWVSLALVQRGWGLFFGLILAFIGFIYLLVFQQKEKGLILLLAAFGLPLLPELLSIYAGLPGCE
jgi:sterol desaturase/sphingolipid hydroxylase (fatty acid hydroxylase superfamily)